MTEIVRVTNPPILQFGKYRGSSAAEVMTRDPAYVEWVLAQPWFQERNPQLVQFFMSAGVENAETPEHNALQAKFTQDAYCLAVAAMFSAGHQIRSSDHVRAEAGALMWPGASTTIVASDPRISDRTFEENAWDVQFRFHGAGARFGGTLEPACSCDPVDETDDNPRAREMYAKRHTSRYRPPSSFSWPGKAWPTHVRDTYKTYTAETQHASVCPRASVGYVIAFSLDEPDSLVDSDHVDFALELKPVMGDDYPAVLRQVHGYRERGRRGESQMAAVVVGSFSSVAVAWPVVKRLFWESKILLVTEAELDDLVTHHADEWGARITTDDDFAVEFASKL